MDQPLFSPTEWNHAIAGLPGSHLLQTWEWGQVKASFGWKPRGVVWHETNTETWQAIEVDADAKSTSRNILPGPLKAAALILQRTLVIGGFTARLRVLYVPKGPLLEWENIPLRNKVLEDLQALARKSGAIFIKIDPDVRLGEGIPGQPDAREEPTGREVTAHLTGNGWHYSSEQIQFRNTVLVDLSPPEEEILKRMKQKSRYNIRLAERKGVSVRVGTSADWGLLYRMYAKTSLRDGFVIRGEDYYRTIWNTFSGKPPASDTTVPTMEPLIAEVAGEPVAAVVIYRFAGTAWYLSGMSIETHREKMPNYLLQWEAMRRAKAAGCSAYDLWGAPDVFTESDTLWGVYRFKEGLGGKVIRTLGAWDYPARPIVYHLYTQILPRLLDRMRHKGKIQTRQIALGS